MREFRKKQKLFKRIMNIVLTASALFLFAYIGVYPMIKDALGQTGLTIISYVADVMVIACLVILFIYYNKYSKCDKFLEAIENELDDTGYYFTSRKENSVADYKKVVIEDLRKNGFSVDEMVEVDGLEFDAIAYNKKELIYIITNDIVDKNDLVAYVQSAIYDVTSIKIKRKANVVMLYICNNAEDGAISLSKMITPLGKKEQIKIANAVVEISSGRCYFLGNNPTKCQQLIANYAMNCNVPIKDEYIGKERLTFQDELEEHMKEFNLKDFKNGNFYAH